MINSNNSELQSANYLDIVLNLVQHHRVVQSCDPKTSSGRRMLIAALNKKGFTLSEVMITIGVLGVLAAILVPAVMKTAPDNTKIMFKKTYSSLERSVEELINDDVHYPEDGAGTSCVDLVGGAAVNCGFSYTTLTGSIPAGNNKFCYLLADKLNTTSTNCTTSMINTDASDWNFTTTDGIKWKIYSTGFPLSSNGYNTYVIVDVNGDKKPNCSDSGLIVADCADVDPNAPPDQFEIGIRYDGKINPYGTAGLNILTNPTDNAKD